MDFMNLFGLDKDNKKKDRPRISSGAGFSLLAGFTLVEALAVIAMIGFMAAIIVVNIRTSKKQGEDTAVKSALHEINNAAELYYHQNYSYEGVCDAADSTISDAGDFGRIKAYINQYNGQDSSIGCRANDDGFAVVSSLNLGDCWCVDYQGTSKKVSLGSENKCQDVLTTITCP